jgi:hypothetical protein
MTITSFLQKWLPAAKDEEVQQQQPVEVEEIKLPDTEKKPIDQYMKYASETLEQVKNKGNEFIAKAKECDETQHKVIAAARTALDMTAISLGPVGGVIGGVVGVADTETTKTVCKKIDAATQGVWNDLSFEGKLFSLGTGIGLGVLVWYVYVPILSYTIFTIANIYAAKRGADFTTQNKAHEAELSRQNNILEQADQPEDKQKKEN